MSFIESLEFQKFLSNLKKKLRGPKIFLKIFFYVIFAQMFLNPNFKVQEGTLKTEI